MFEKLKQYSDDDQKYWTRLKAVQEIRNNGFQHPDSHKAIDEFIRINSDKNPVDLYLDLSDIYLEAGEHGEFREILEEVLKMAEEAGNTELTDEIKNRIIIEGGRN